ncbi:hypothetical protein GGR56DRAFT_141819 [Xylariaceae sp. FL0804]|nr:hypothetical protein GGR56DRAFT_141819 [Xylariaceae sp. FL0804]
MQAPFGVHTTIRFFGLFLCRTSSHTTASTSTVDITVLVFMRERLGSCPGSKVLQQACLESRGVPMTGARYLPNLGCMSTYPTYLPSNRGGGRRAGQLLRSSNIYHFVPHTHTYTHSGVHPHGVVGRWVGRGNWALRWLWE